MYLKVYVSSYLNLIHSIDVVCEDTEVMRQKQKKFQKTSQWNFQKLCFIKINQYVSKTEDHAVKQSDQDATALETRTTLKQIPSNAT